ncbi:MAG: F0F1 ATP synthase subunit delta [Dehalococcoidia bacterium]|nr:F0F1 ATP synthase subunit delta [Dehalococcoidia bacterium]
MADVAAAKRYAQAAFGIARDSGTLATWRAELADVAAVLADSQLAPVLANASLLSRRDWPWSKGRSPSRRWS